MFSIPGEAWKTAEKRKLDILKRMRYCLPKLQMPSFESTLWEKKYDLEEIWFGRFTRLLKEIFWEFPEINLGDFTWYL